MNNGLSAWPSQVVTGVAKTHHQEGRRQRKSRERRETTPPTRAQQADGKAELAAGWTGQELAKSD
jgi:hypothetical protein